MRIFKLIYYALLNTKNIYRSFVGDTFKNNIINDKKSEFNKQHWTFMKLFKLFSDLFLLKLPISAPSWIPKHIKTIFLVNAANISPIS